MKKSKTQRSAESLRREALRKIDIQIESSEIFSHVFALNGKTTSAVREMSRVKELKSIRNIIKRSK